MPLDADALVDRRSLRRRLSVWRTIAIILVVAAIGAAVFVAAGGDALSGRGAPHVARVTIGGIITDDRKQQALLRRLADTPSVRGVILSIDSPGGTTAGSEGLYAAVRQLADAKPVAAYIGSLAASGGYIAALGTDHIVARRNAITGSIGVLAQYADVSRLLDTLGIGVGAERSGPLKAQPDGLTPPSPEAKAVLAGIVDDSFQWFLGLVMERRGMDEATARPLADGRIFTGHQALEVGLVDELGEEPVAVAWMVRDRGVPAGLSVVPWKVESEGFAGLFESLSKAFWGGLVNVLGLDETVATARLDGLLSLWQGFGSIQGPRPGDPTR